jgi:hypothetical protein
MANSLRSTQEGRATYGDSERGATLPQAWQMHRALTGYLKVCLLTHRLPSTATDGIPEVVLFSPANLVRALARGFAKMEGFAPQLFVHDGRVGHSLHARSHDPATGTFTYHDPWPGRSLLCFEFNIAGVGAEPVEDGRWRITDTELERVICAAFIMPTEWAELTGRAYRISYAALQQSDFWKFFHLREIDRLALPTRTAVSLKPGGFQPEVDLDLQLDQAGGVRMASLGLRRGWALEPRHGINRFAVDIAKSFLDALLPEPDRIAGSSYVQALRALREPATVRALAPRLGQPDLSEAERLQLVYLGHQIELTVPLAFCRIATATAARGGEPWWRLTIDLH